MHQMVQCLSHRSVTCYDDAKITRRLLQCQEGKLFENIESFEDKKTDRKTPENYPQTCPLLDIGEKVINFTRDITSPFRKFSGR